MKPAKTMASSLFVLLSLTIVAFSIASPVPTEDTATTTDSSNDVALIEVVEVVDEIPVIIPLVETTTTAEEVHKVAKRSLRGDNPNNDLLASLDGLQYDNGLSELAGRRIKFLPTWLG